MYNARPGRFKRRSLTGLSALTLAIGCTGGATAETTVIHAGHIINPANGEMLADRYISVVDGRIASVDQARPPVSEEQMVDLSNSWVMPGLFDAHTHLTFNFAVGICAAYVDQGTGYRALTGLKNAWSMLTSGFTTVRDLGNAANYADTDLRLAIENGLFNGPTIINAGKIIAPLGGQADRAAPEFGACWSYEYIDADGVDGVRKAIRQNLLYGAKAIKIVNDARSGLHGTYSDEELAVAVGDAHRAGLSIAVHAKEDATALPAVKAGVDSIEHGYRITAATLKAMARQGTYLVPTDVPPTYFPTPLADPEAYLRLRVGRLRSAYEMGVPLAFGTDTAFNKFGRNRGEMAFELVGLWTRAGIPNMEVLKAMTINAARLLRVDGERGQIAVGQYADIVAMDGNPVSDLDHLSRVRFVMKNGVVIRNDHAGYIATMPMR